MSLPPSHVTTGTRLGPMSSKSSPYHHTARHNNLPLSASSSELHQYLTKCAEEFTQGCGPSSVDFRIGLRMRGVNGSWVNRFSQEATHLRVNTAKPDTILEHTHLDTSRTQHSPVPFVSKPSRYVSGDGSAHSADQLIPILKPEPPFQRVDTNLRVLPPLDRTVPRVCPSSPARHTLSGLRANIRVLALRDDRALHSKPNQFHELEKLSDRSTVLPPIIQLGKTKQIHLSASMQRLPSVKPPLTASNSRKRGNSGRQEQEPLAALPAADGQVAHAVRVSQAFGNESWARAVGHRMPKNVSERHVHVRGEQEGELNLCSKYVSSSYLRRGVLTT
jgi:hypothetical protein